MNTSTSYQRNLNCKLNYNLHINITLEGNSPCADEDLLTIPLSVRTYQLCFSVTLFLQQI